MDMLLQTAVIKTDKTYSYLSQVVNANQNNDYGKELAKHRSCFQMAPLQESRHFSKVLPIVQSVTYYPRFSYV